MSFGGPPPGGFGGPPPDGGGGFGGPPGGGAFGGPPGGGYGPPGGGPPPGGGFGPPPGGGPPGGYNGPPGGFGPPGGGPFGPPPGQFGPPPFNGPPMQPPQKGGSNMGLFIGLGCGGLALLGIIGAVVSVFVMRGSASSPPPAYSPPPITAPTPTKAGGSVGGGSLKAELRDLTPIKSKYGKSVRFIGEIVNTGSDTIGYPAAKVTFYDAAGTAVDSGTCASLIRVLPATDKVPCGFSIFKGLDYATYKVEITPFAPSFQGEVADIGITDIKFTPKRGYKPDTLEGKLTNKSNFKAKNVWAIVTLYDGNKKIVGTDATLVAGNDLDAGQAGLFSAKVYETAGTPESYRVVSVGYSQ